MGFVDWLRSVFSGTASKRDVSRLAGVSEHDVDLVDEAIAPEGSQLQPSHRRLVSHDRRLLPKRRVPFPGRKRPTLMSNDEAARLFSSSGRTRDRRLRTLTTDAAQLERYGLPLLESEGDVAALLDVPVAELRFFSIHRHRERVVHYVTFARPKRGGGERLIMAPKRRLKAIQRRLKASLVDKLPRCEHAHGFVTGRSIRSNAEPHVGQAVVVHLDIADFFPSVHFGRVRGLLVALGYGFPVATTLAVLMTEAERQPVVVDGQTFFVPVGPRYCVQGAPTSPGLCNAIVLRMDRRLAGLARSMGLAYTRYADDMTFSGDAAGAVHALIGRARAIVAAEGFSLNGRKTRVMRRGGRQSVTGVVVNDTLGLSRRERRLLRAAAHRLGRLAAEGAADPKELARLEGQLAYLHMLNPAQAQALRDRLPQRRKLA